MRPASAPVAPGERRSAPAASAVRPAGSVPRVPFLDLAAGVAELRPELDAAWAAVVDGGRWVLGPRLEAFEAAFAAHAGTAHAVGVGTGLDALEIALRAHGVGPGDEVLVPAHTFVATWLAVSRTGATPVGVDVRPDTLTIDPAAAADAVGPRTAAIVPVHLYGHPADPGALAALADREGLLLVEDAAQAHGARWVGRRCGALGHAGAFSFYPGKNLGALGDGGAITTDDPADAARARRLRNYGSSVRYHHDEVGGNSRLDELQAAILHAKLDRLDAWNARRSRVATTYRRALAGVPGLTLPAVDPGVEPSWHLFAVRHPERDRLREELDAAGIDTLIHYPVPPHRSGAYASGPQGRRSFPVAERAAATLLSLPIGPHLDDASVERVVAAVRAAAGRPSAADRGGRAGRTAAASAEWGG